MRERRDSPGCWACKFVGLKSQPARQHRRHGSWGRAPRLPQPAELAPLVTPLRGRASGASSGASEPVLGISVFCCLRPTALPPGSLLRSRRAEEPEPGGCARSAPHCVCRVLGCATTPEIRMRKVGRLPMFFTSARAGRNFLFHTLLIFHPATLGQCPLFNRDL